MARLGKEGEFDSLSDQESNKVWCRRYLDEQSVLRLLCGGSGGWTVDKRLAGRTTLP